jgi:hypothetical protein
MVRVCVLWVENVYNIFYPLGRKGFQIVHVTFRDICDIRIGQYEWHEGWWVVKRRVVKKRNIVVVSMIARGGAGSGYHKSDKRKNRKPKHKKDWRKDEDQ